MVQINQIIYIPLLDEGTECYCPSSAIQISANLFKITGSPKDGESWQFRSGETVYCEDHIFSGGMRGLLAKHAEA
jgi:hypothetical protein